MRCTKVSYRTIASRSLIEDGWNGSVIDVALHQYRNFDRWQHFRPARPAHRINSCPPACSIPSIHSIALCYTRLFALFIPIPRRRHAPTPFRRRHGYDIIVQFTVCSGCRYCSLRNSRQHQQLFNGMERSRCWLINAEAFVAEPDQPSVPDAT